MPRMVRRIHAVYAAYLLLFGAALALPEAEELIRGYGMLILAVLPAVLIYYKRLLDSRFWQTVAVAHLFWSTGQVAWILSNYGFPLSQAVQDFCYWLFKLSILGAVLYRPYFKATTIGRRQHLIDTAAAMSFMAFYVAYMFAAPALSGDQVTRSFYGTLAGALLNAGIAITVVVLARNARSSHWRTTYFMIAAGMTSYTAASVAFLFNQGVPFADPFWCLTFWSMSLAVAFAPPRDAKTLDLELMPSRYGAGIALIASAAVVHAVGSRIAEQSSRLMDVRAVLTITEILLVMVLVYLRQKATVEESDHRSRLLAGTLNSVRQPIFIVDSQYRVTQSNEVFRSRFVGDSIHCYNLVFGKSAPCEWCKLKDGRGFSASVEVPAASFQVEFSPLPSSEGKIGGIELLIDMSVERKRQQQLIQTERMAALGRMIAGTAHELNNPLAIVLGNAQLLRDDPHLDADGRQQVTAIAAAAERARDIVHTFLTLSRPSDGDKALVDVVAVIQSIEHLKASELRSYRINLELDLPESLTILGKFTLLQEVFLNLIDNARDAIREANRGYGSILVSGRITPSGKVRIDVSDDGTGIRRDDRAHIFDLFFSTKGVGQGTGLGLSVSRSIVLDHGGRIDVETDGETFTRFELEFEHFRLSTQGYRAAGPEPPHLRILVVDDEPDILNILQRYLTRHGHHVECTTTGTRALHLLSKNKFDVALVDYRMPEMDGRTIITRLKSMTPPVSVRTIVLSGDTMNEETRKFIVDNSIPMVRKPVDLEKLNRLLVEA